MDLSTLTALTRVALIAFLLPLTYRWHYRTVGLCHFHLVSAFSLRYHSPRTGVLTYPTRHRDDDRGDGTAARIKELSARAMPAPTPSTHAEGAVITGLRRLFIVECGWRRLGLL